MQINGQILSDSLMERAEAEIYLEGLFWESVGWYGDIWLQWDEDTKNERYKYVPAWKKSAWDMAMSVSIRALDIPYGWRDRLGLLTDEEREYYYNVIPL